MSFAILRCLVRFEDEFVRIANFDVWVKLKLESPITLFGKITEYVKSKPDKIFDSPISVTELRKFKSNEARVIYAMYDYTLDLLLELLNMLEVNEAAKLLLNYLDDYSTAKWRINRGLIRILKQAKNIDNPHDYLKVLRYACKMLKFKYPCKVFSIITHDFTERILTLPLSKRLVLASRLIFTIEKYIHEQIEYDTERDRLEKVLSKFKSRISESIEAESLEEIIRVIPRLSEY